MKFLKKFFKENNHVGVLEPGETFHSFEPKDIFIESIKQANDAFVNIAVCTNFENISHEYGQVIEYLIERDKKYYEKNDCGFGKPENIKNFMEKYGGHNEK